MKLVNLMTIPERLLRAGVVPGAALPCRVVAVEPSPTKILVVCALDADPTLNLACVILPDQVSPHRNDAGTVTFFVLKEGICWTLTTSTLVTHADLYDRWPSPGFERSECDGLVLLVWRRADQRRPEGDHPARFVELYACSECGRRISVDTAAGRILNSYPCQGATTDE